MKDECTKWGCHFQTVSENPKEFTEKCRICGETVTYKKKDLDEKKYAYNNRRKTIQPSQTEAWRLLTERKRL